MPSPWIDERGMLHGLRAQPVGLDTTTGQAWLASVSEPFVVYAGGQPVTISPETTEDDQTAWCATVHLADQLQRVPLTHPQAMTKAWIRQLAQHIAAHTTTLPPLPFFDRAAAERTLAEAQESLAQGKLGKVLGRALVAQLTEALTILAATQARLALIEQRAQQPPAPPPPLPVPPSPLQAPATEETTAPPKNLRLSGPSEEAVLAQIATQRERHGDQVVFGTPTPTASGGWIAYGLPKPEPREAEPEAAPTTALSTATAEPPPASEAAEPPTRSPNVNDDIQHAASLRQQLQRELDKQGGENFINPKRAQVIIEMLQEALALRTRIGTLELLLKYLPALIMLPPAERDAAISALEDQAAQDKALKKLADQLADLAEIVAANLAESRKLIGKLRSRLLGLAWKIHELLGTSTLQRLWSEAEDMGLDPEAWIIPPEPLEW